MDSERKELVAPPPPWNQVKKEDLIFDDRNSELKSNETKLSLAWPREGDVWGEGRGGCICDLGVG